MLRALLIDDEEPARRIIKEYLADFPEIVPVGEAENGAQGVTAILELDPDVVFLDIQMPLLNGFETLAHVRSAEHRMPSVIFSTAFDSYALEAFEINAVDYLLKPYDRARFRTAVSRVLERSAMAGGELERLVRLLTLAVPKQMSPLPEHLMVRAGNKVVPIRAAEIEWIEAADNYAILHSGGESYVASTGIGELERRLPPETFMRVHRSSIINVTLIRHLEPDGSGGMVATMQSGSLVKVSRSYATDLRKLFL